MTEATVAGLQAETQRLARAVALLNLALNQGFNVQLAETLVSPVITRAQNVRVMAQSLVAQGVVDITMEITDALSEQLLNDLIPSSAVVPDDLSSLLEGPDAH